MWAELAGAELVLGRVVRNSFGLGAVRPGDLGIPRAKLSRKYLLYLLATP